MRRTRMLSYLYLFFSFFARRCYFCHLTSPDKAAGVVHPSIDEFDISEATKGHLRGRGIDTLFPIQVGGVLVCNVRWIVRTYIL